eukprot:scaffold3497_cov67-Phaeocystis_antarctica.AAC.1
MVVPRPAGQPAPLEAARVHRGWIDERRGAHAALGALRVGLGSGSDSGKGLGAMTPNPNPTCAESKPSRSSSAQLAKHT